MIVLNEETINLIINDIESNQNKERKTDDFKSYQIYEGNQREYVEARLKCIFPDSHTVMRVSNVNVLKKVVDKIGQAYDDAPIRLVNGEPNENLNEIYSNNNFDDAFDSMDITYNRSRCGLMWIQNDLENNKAFRPVSLNQYTFDVLINNDTLELEGVFLSYPKTQITTPVSSNNSDGVNQLIAEHQRDSANDATVYAMWTKDQHINVIKSINEKTTTIDYIKRDETDEGVNELGLIPFVWYTRNPNVPEFPVKNPLPTDSVEINIMGSNLLTAAQMQIGQLVLSYPVGSAINTIHKGYTVSLELPQSKDDDPLIPTTAEYIVPNSDLTGMKDVTIDYAASILSDNGLEGATMAGTAQNFASGFERLIASASVVNIQKKNQKYYANREKKVFEIIKKYDEINETKLFSKDDVLTVNFKEPQVIMSESDKLDIIERREDIGLDEEHEKFIRDNPHMGIEDAKAKLLRIKAEKEANMPDLTPGAPTVENEEEEEDVLNA